jgi:hypothetical protein
MKRKVAIINLALMALVQLTIAWQSFHAFSHTHHHHHENEKHAKHFGAGTHHSDSDDDCAVCDFHFDFFVAPQQFCLTLEFPYTHIPYHRTSIESATFYAGSLFALRAPPASV